MPKLYDELAEWWPLFSRPEEYEKEAEVFNNILKAHQPIPKTLLELGCGGGNNALYMKSEFEPTLSDLSAGMLAVSKRLNPECTHVQGDMRTLRLGSTFGAVFVHDAIMYMTSLDELRKVVDTAFAHCNDQGVALFAPDWVRETFAPETDDDAFDGPDRSLRWLEWVHDLGPDGSTYYVDYAILLKSEDGSVRVVHDRHLEAVFPEQAWLDTLRAAGFAPDVIQDPIESNRRLFVGRR